MERAMPELPPEPFLCGMAKEVILTPTDDRVRFRVVTEVRGIIEFAMPNELAMMTLKALDTIRQEKVLLIPEGPSSHDGKITTFETRGRKPHIRQPDS
jgi:hypothetical protein